MVPKYPFRVISYHKNGDRQWHESHNYETLIAAMHYRDITVRKQQTTRVEVMACLDESVGFQR